jgi:hypothetical protein
LNFKEMATNGVKTSIKTIATALGYLCSSVWITNTNPNDPIAPGAKLIDVGQSCCDECWCITDEGEEECPRRTTASHQLYTEDMVYDFGNKTLVDPDTFEVVPSNKLIVLTGCNPYEGVSKHTSPPWKAYNGCELLTPAQTFDSTSADGYDEAVCVLSFTPCSTLMEIVTHTRTRHTQFSGD